MTGRNINWVTLAKQHVVSTRTWGALTKKWCPLSTMGTWGDGEIRKQGKLRQLLWHKIQLNDCFVNFRYFQGIQRNLNLMPIVYPGWIMRLYVESRCTICSKKVLMQKHQTTWSPKLPFRQGFRPGSGMLTGTWQNFGWGFRHLSTFRHASFWNKIILKILAAWTCCKA